jgi:hypothetical protein
MEPHDVAVKAVGDVAKSMNLDVDPVLVARVAGLVIGVLAGNTWAEAEKAGVDRAVAKVTDLAAADAAGRARR